jgi:outer membrane protein assembly factor BamB
MLYHRSIRACLIALCCFLLGADWHQFRGPGGLAVSDETGIPTEWSSKKNLIWRTMLPGAGTSSPIVASDHVYLTCYSGYALDAAKPGNMDDLRRHLVCLDPDNGKIRWQKEFKPLLPEHAYQGEGSYHGYSSSTPASDGEHLYVFFGKSGVFCFDLDGRQIWHADVGKGTHGWGSGTSPVLYKNLVLINASVESGSVVALDRTTGKEIWRTGGINSAWNTPMLVPTPDGSMELVVSVQDRLVALNPDSGKEIWHAEGVHRYVCPSVVHHDGVVYAIGGGHTSLAVRAGGHGDVSKSNGLWRQNKGSNVSSPIYHNRYIYWASDNGGVVNCQEAASGRFVYQERLKPDSGLIYASPLLADGKIYYVSQHNGTYVVAAKPEFKLLAHNVFADDNSRANASPAISKGRLLLRTDRALYCIGNH